jgi:hypothetical protein
MKTNLIIKKFKQTDVVGTMSSIEERLPFGGKMIDIEDEINVNDIFIQYSEVVDTSTGFTNNGFQYLIEDPSEDVIVKDLSNLKLDNITVELDAQSETDLENNTNVTGVDNSNTVSSIEVKYNQTKSSKDYKFDYYFNFNFTRI